MNPHENIPKIINILENANKFKNNQKKEVMLVLILEAADLGEVFDLITNKAITFF